MSRACCEIIRVQTRHIRRNGRQARALFVDEWMPEGTIKDGLLKKIECMFFCETFDKLPMLSDLLRKQELSQAERGS